MAQDFLNMAVLGSNLTPANKRGFRSVSINELANPNYDFRYFETFPSAWAQAYAFRKALEKGDKVAIEEWAVLLMLHFFGTLHLRQYTAAAITQNFDPDLWLALEKTYPKSGEGDELSEIWLLRADDTVIGAYYKPIVFFPNRGREAWLNSSIKGYVLPNGQLSWENCKSIFNNDVDAQRRLNKHLRRVARMLDGTLRTTLNEFVQRTLGNAPPDEMGTGRLPIHPKDFDVDQLEFLSFEKLLEAYPLRKPNKNKGTTYYLLNDNFGGESLPADRVSSWMSEPVATSRPTPRSYFRVADNEIAIHFRGEVFSGTLNETDDIVMLATLFLPDKVSYCKFSREDSNFAKKYVQAHNVPLKDDVVNPNETAVCLMPLRPSFFEHFPEIFKEENRNTIQPVPQEGESVEWRIPIFFDNRVVKHMSWVVRHKQSDGLNEITAQLYPPKVSPDWKLYALYGTGRTDTFGHWLLLDEKGNVGTPFDLKLLANSPAENYVSLLKPPSNVDTAAEEAENAGHRTRSTNYPRAMLYKDAGGRECGILMLRDLPEVFLDNQRDVTLSVDFGTSNTSLAIRDGEDSEVLKFTLTPEYLWGKLTEDDGKPRAEKLGFVPSSWSAQDKGFFPTILASRLSENNLPTTSPQNLQVEDLFKVDIPALHKGLEAGLGESINRTWDIHSNLKWEQDPRTPWRSLFLSLTMLYAHTEVFFTKRAKISNYVFTYPLAFSKEYDETYHSSVKRLLQKNRHYCYGEDPNRRIDESNYKKRDESSAIAVYNKDFGTQGSLEIFVDIGGGTADIAIRHNRDFLVLDSLTVAGKSFFRFAKENLSAQPPSGSKQFLYHLGRLLQNREDGFNKAVLHDKMRLAEFYGVMVNSLDEETFKQREGAIIKNKMGDSSYQRYRTRMLFQHVLTYALIQACAAAVAHDLKLTNGISLTLGGNGWGLLMFAEWGRSHEKLLDEARYLLRDLVLPPLRDSLPPEKKHLLENIDIENITLLNRTNLSEAKICVALGALKAGQDATVEREKSVPFAGMTVKDLQLNNETEVGTIEWFERWSVSTINKKFNIRADSFSTRFHQHDDQNSPFAEIMKAFTIPGNLLNGKVDNMSKWRSINAQLFSCIAQMRSDDDLLVHKINDRETVSATPLNFFLSRILYDPDTGAVDYLDELAKTNGSYNGGS